FPILTLTYMVCAFLFYQFKFRKMYAGSAIDNTALGEMSLTNPMKYIKNKKFAVVVLGVFLATILGMALRQFTGLYLGFIALTGMIVLVLIMEIFQKKLEGPNFETVIDELDMRTLFFYVTLFALVGGIDHVGIIKMIAGAMAPYIQSDLILSSDL
ncbi:unnamed protein product, partial [marine sediment metagenome]